MKVRQGFVSNSSTTSFCIYGVGTNEDIWTQARDAGLVHERFQDYSDAPQYALGVPFTDIRDDETGAQFKERVRKAVRRLLPDVSDDDFGVQEDAYRDG